MKPSESIEISVVVPVYNEEGNLPVLIPKLMKVLKGLGLSYELIFVDDGSSDGSRTILKEMASQYPFFRVLRLRENRGLSTALVAGKREARGEKIVTLDSDLQNNPADIPRLLEYLDRYDMATGWRQKREDTWLKKISSKIGNAVRNRVFTYIIKISPKIVFVNVSGNGFLQRSSQSLSDVDDRVCPSPDSWKRCFSSRST